MDRSSQPQHYSSINCKFQMACYTICVRTTRINDLLQGKAYRAATSFCSIGLIAFLGFSARFVRGKFTRVSANPDKERNGEDDDGSIRKFITLPFINQYPCYHNICVFACINLSSNPQISHSLEQTVRIFHPLKKTNDD
jgi:hypothetical protein